MSLNVDPICVAVEESCADLRFFSHSNQLSKRKLSISGRCITLFRLVPSQFFAGLDITADRLFGPQPHTSTYVCIWSIQMGKIKGFINVHEGQILALSVGSFLHGFNDPFNAPSEEYQQSPLRDGENSFPILNECHDQLLLSNFPEGDD